MTAGATVIWLASAAFATQAAPSPPAPATYSFAEERCVYDALLAVSTPINTQAEFDALVAQCRARYGWSEAKARVDVEIATYLTEMANAVRALRAAGVDYALLAATYDRITPADRLVIGSPLTHPEPERQAAGRRLASLIVAAGFRADSGQLTSFFVARAALDASVDRFHAAR